MSAWWGCSDNSSGTADATIDGGPVIADGLPQEADSGPPPTIRVLDAHPVLGETTAVVLVVLSHSWDETIQVDFTTDDDTAVGDPAGAGDYVPQTTTLSLARGTLMAQVDIPVQLPYQRVTLETSLAKRFKTRLSNARGATIEDGEGVVTLAQAGMVIETPLAQKLYDADVVPDFNGDDKTDLVLAAEGGMSTLLLSAGTTFQEAEHVVVDEAYLAGDQGFGWPVALGEGLSFRGGFVAGDHSMAADFNGDGASDLLVVGEGKAHFLYGHQGPFFNFTSGDARLQDGVHGTWLMDMDFGYGGGTMQVGDWNGDGLVDWAQSHAFSSVKPGSSDTVNAHYGTGGPYGETYASADGFSFVSGTNAVGVGSQCSGARPGVGGDLNGDGADDIIFVGLSSNDGQFGGHYLFVFFSSEQKHDFSNRNLNETLDGTNGFQVNDGTYPNNLQPFAPQDAGDLNGDGLQDLVVTGGNQQLAVIFGKETGFAKGKYTGLADMGDEVALFTTDQRPATARTGDLNRDGIEDLVFITENKLRVLWGQEGLTGREVLGTQYPEMGELDIDPASGLDRVEVVGDVDGDGTADIVLVSASWKENTGGAVILFGKTVTRKLGGPNLDDPEID